MPESSSNSEERKIEGQTPHAKERSEEAQEGDLNRVIREGRRFKDMETGYDVYVRGDKVVIVDPTTNLQITQFKNSRANTQKRVESGRWKPLP